MRSSFVVRSLLAAFALLALTGSAQAAVPTPVTSCGTTISAPGDYVLAADIDCAGGQTAIYVNSDDVNLSLNGHTITNVGFMAVQVNKIPVTNVHVTGPGAITNSYIAMYTQRATNSGFDGITLEGNTFGAYMEFPGSGTYVHNINSHHSSNTAVVVYNPAGIDVSGNTCSDGQIGILVSGGSGPADVHGNTCTGNSYVGIYITSNGGHQIHANTATGNAVYDGYDETSGCGTNQWFGNLFGTFNQACVNNAPGPGAGGPVCTITGTAGADRIRGTAGDDVICGLGGDDFLDGRGGNDEIYGGEGVDTLVGKGGNDTLVGGIGNDLLLPGAGNDSADGGDGTRDRVLYSDITGGGVHVLLASGVVSPEGGSNVGSDTLSNLEQVFGSEQNDVMIAQQAGVASTLKGGAGDDYLDVADGDGLDTVVGNQGSDTCAVSAGDQARDC
jgi:parallel beta-helix repeat protein